MIAHVGELTAWMRAQMPALDEDRYLPWNSGTPTVGSLVTLIHVRIETPFTPDQATTVVLVAHPVRTDDTEPVVGPTDPRTTCPTNPAAPLPEPLRPSVFRFPRGWRTRRSRRGS
ncbi:hypothetical protein BOX37_27820 [Nocardia mangyaensis]|uniref:Uncharacterized protein n=1 Tax=Nocardia mangyaensis TaxID=2213200 RepID=A0A1J0VYT6_9NOCA|nr:hypothetical protein [Nocardia mangyaensis]APE37103.1 hypothetical protein BOX37_27820 [Nocardia mangyaensis]